jgi:hypothetical protein
VRGRLLILSVVIGGCQPTTPAVITPPPVTPSATAPTLPASARTLAVAVAVGSPTPTVVVASDYPTLVRPRIERIQKGLTSLEQQLGLLVQSPVRMAQDDWRAQTASMLDELAAASQDLRALGARSGADAARFAEVDKLLTDLDFVVDEYRMAFDFDPDGTHLVRAGRAERTTAAEVASIISELRSPIGVAPTLTPAR